MTKSEKAIRDGKREFYISKIGSRTVFGYISWRVARGHFDVMMCGMGGSADTLDKARRMMQANGYTKTDKIGHISNFIPIIVYDKDGEVIDLQSI